MNFSISLPREVIELVQFAADSLDRPRLHAVHLDITPTVVKATATNGCHLAQISVDAVEYTGEGATSVLLDAEALRPVCKFRLSKTAPPYPYHLVVECGGYTIATHEGHRCLGFVRNDVPPGYEQVIPDVSRDADAVYRPFSYDLKLLGVLGTYLTKIGAKPRVVQKMGAGADAVAPILFHAVLPMGCTLIYVLMPVRL